MMKIKIANKARIVRSQIVKAAALAIFMSLAISSCVKSPEPSYPTEPNDRGWRWPAKVSHDGKHLNPPGTFGVLHVWLGDAPAPPKTRSDQITEVVTAVNQQVKGPITFLIVTWTGFETDLDQNFYEEFLDTEEPQMYFSSFAADPTQIEVFSEYSVPYFILKGIKTEGQTPGLFKFQFQVKRTSDFLSGEDDDSQSGGRYRGGGMISLFVNSSLPASESTINITEFTQTESADMYFSRVDEGVFWKHWTMFPLYWEKEKLFEPPDNAASTPAGAALFSHAGSLHMVWGAQSINSDFRVASLASGSDPTAFSPAGLRSEIISPDNGTPIGSHFSPGVEVFKDKIYLAWKTRENGELRILRSESAEFAPGESHLWRPSYLTAAGPALVNTGRRKLIVAFRGRAGDFLNYDDNHIYIMETADGNNWTDPRVIADGASEDSSPSLAYLNGRTVLVYKNISKDKVYLKFSDDDGATWSPKHEIAHGPAYSDAFESPILLAVKADDRLGEILWEDPGDLFYLLDGVRGVTRFRSDQTSFDDLEWRWIGYGGGHISACYFDFRFFVVSVDSRHGNYLNLVVSPQSSELAVPWLAL